MIVTETITCCIKTENRMRELVISHITDHDDVAFPLEELQILGSEPLL